MPTGLLLTMPAELRKWPICLQKLERTDVLDSLGNTTAATGKGFAIGSAALTSLALIGAYKAQVEALAPAGFEFSLNCQSASFNRCIHRFSATLYICSNDHERCRYCGPAHSRGGPPAV